MTLPELSIKRHVLAWMLNGVLVLFGVISFALVWLKEELVTIALRSRLAKAQYKRRIILAGLGKPRGSPKRRSRKRAMSIWISRLISGVLYRKQASSRKVQVRKRKRKQETPPPENRGWLRDGMNDHCSPRTGERIHRQERSPID